MWDDDDGFSFLCNMNIQTHKAIIKLFMLTHIYNTHVKICMQVIKWVWKGLNYTRDKNSGKRKEDFDLGWQ